MAEEKYPKYCKTALACIREDWLEIGLKGVSLDVDILSHRITALFVPRVAAIVAPLGTYPDLSVTSICKHLIKTKEGWPLTDQVLKQLQKFVRCMFDGYKKVEYHNVLHAYHVVLSASKLLDIMLYAPSSKQGLPLPPCYGLRNDPLMLFAQVFAALIHDVEHQGVTNRQLAAENDRLAVLYNDQSIAENWSCYVAFSEFLQDQFKDLRKVCFVDEDSYLKFRKNVVSLVLATDIASPERTQIGKSKWKEAFGETQETIERKQRQAKIEQRRTSVTQQQLEKHNSLPSDDADADDDADDLDDKGEVEGGPEGVDFGLTRGLSKHLSELFPEEDSFSGTPEGSIASCPSEDSAESDEEEPPTVAAPVGVKNAEEYGYEEPETLVHTKPKSAGKYKFRLSIRRAVDLSGEKIENYKAGRKGSGLAKVDEDGDRMGVDLSADEPDELKAAVIMETIMLAADVSQNLQSFEHFHLWSDRLYFELRKAYVVNRGMDVRPMWYGNQIGFLESYLLPLARKLEGTGVFGDEGAKFAQNVISIRDRWLDVGDEAVVTVIAEGAKKFPKADED
jgi:hypothetical protein